ncbi:Kinesin-like protein Klp98A [Diplonema papillatum]|nr:Kinesin-like protein Klp98A [Diplonema papillatum]
MSKKTGAAEAKEEGVKVFLRIRPFSKKEIAESGDEFPTPVTDPVDDCKLEFLDPVQGFSVRECMTFDQIFWSIPEVQVPGKSIEFATQEYVYKQTGQQCVEHAFTGYNSCLLAYGQTGSGKTHSMMGSPDDEGIIPRLCKELFQIVDEQRLDPKNTGTTYKVSLSFLEIYNEKVKDLLAVQKGEPADLMHHGEEAKAKHERDFKDLRIRQHPTKGPFVEGLSESEVTGWNECSQMIAHGFAARTTKATAMNAVSSRSHAIFKLELTQSMKTKGGPTKQVHTVSSINLVDLAGSERASRTHAKGDTLVEGIAINQSLTVLRKVIEALMDNGLKMRECKSKGTPFVPKPPPYRESTLTWLLSESFGGNSKTMMIAAASPHESNAEETLQTLKYALKTREIVNTVTRNEDKGMRMLREKNEEIEKLKAMLANASSNPAANPAEVESISVQLKQEEQIKKELLEEHDRLTTAMEQKEVEMQKTLEQLAQQEEKAKSEAEQRARTQRAADIMGKWTRGFALSLDSSKTRKLKEKEEELEKERESKKRIEQENLARNVQREKQLEKERRELQDMLGKEKADMNEALKATKDRLQREHDAVIAVFKKTLQDDNERLQHELAALRTEHMKRVSQLEAENDRLVKDLAKVSTENKASQQTIEVNASSLTGIKQENLSLRNECYELKEANVRLREENSTLRLTALQVDAVDECEGGRPTRHELEVLEARVNELLEDKGRRLKEIALMKADKKALEMENKELETEVETSKRSMSVCQAKLKAADAELAVLKQRDKDAEAKRKSGSPSFEDEMIIDLEAQMDLIKRAKAKTDKESQELKVENELLKSQMKAMGFSAEESDSFARGDLAPASFQGKFGDSPPPKKSSHKNILELIKDTDSKVSTCRKALVEIRLQPAEQDYDAIVARQDSLQESIASHLADVAGSMVEVYDQIKTMIDRGGIAVLDSEKEELRERLDTAESTIASLRNQLTKTETLLADALQNSAAPRESSKPTFPVSAPSQNTVGLENEEMRVLVQELAQTKIELEKAKASVVEKVVEVASPAVDLPSDVVELQEELEDAKAEVEFQQNMAAMLEEQLDDLKDFEARYLKMKEVMAKLGFDGDDVDVFLTESTTIENKLADYEVLREELEDAKRRGIGATVEDLEFYTTKARVLEETVTDLTSAAREMEQDMLRANYDLQQERASRGKDLEKARKREDQIQRFIIQYEEEVRTGFETCKQRHQEVWRELRGKRRALEELKRKALRGTLHTGDFEGIDEPPLQGHDWVEPAVAVEPLNSFFSSAQGEYRALYADPAASPSRAAHLAPSHRSHSGTSSPEVPILPVEDHLLSRHQRLAAARKSVVDAAHSSLSYNSSPSQRTPQPAALRAFGSVPPVAPPTLSHHPKSPSRGGGVDARTLSTLGNFTGSSAVSCSNTNLSPPTRSPVR